MFFGELVTTSTVGWTVMAIVRCGWAAGKLYAMSYGMRVGGESEGAPTIEAL